MLNMKRIFAVLAVVALMLPSELSAQQPYSQRMVESLSLKTYTNNRGETSLATANFSYVPGLVAKSVLAAYNLYGNEAYWEAVKSYADRQLTGNPDKPILIGDNDIDAINAGKVFFDLYTHSLEKGDTGSAARYKEAAAYMHDKLQNHHARIPEGLPGAGGFFHKGKYPNQMWLDGLYMGSAFYAGYEALFGKEDNREAWTDIAKQFETIHKYTWDKKKHLNYHAWSATPDDEDSFWARKENPYKGTSPEFWARGCGWYFAALADVLEVMPKNHPEYKKILRIYRQVADGLAQWQDKSGSWYQLLQYDNQTCADGIGDRIGERYFNVGTNPNYLESSASSMFTYAFCKGIRLGLLKEKKFAPIAKKAFQGLLDNFITENADGSINIEQSCASAGLGPKKNINRTGTINYYLCGGDTGITRNEGKAIGAFTLAACEYEQLFGSAQ